MNGTRGAIDPLTVDYVMVGDRMNVMKWLLVFDCSFSFSLPGMRVTNPTSQVRVAIDDMEVTRQNAARVGLG